MSNDSKFQPPEPPKGLFFLAKDGKTFGPYGEKEVDQLKADGKINDYQWIWSSETKNWSALLSAPKAPERSQQELLSKPIPSSPQASVQAKNPLFISGIQVICHNQRSILSGYLKELDEAGLWIQGSSTSPHVPFGDREKVSMHFLDEKSGETIHLLLQVQTLKKQESDWMIRFEWKQTPEWMEKLYQNQESK